MHWTPPTSLPNLSAARGLVVDLEFRDDALNRDMGLGWPWRDGYVVGVAIAPLDGDAAWYFPIRHEGGDNYHDPHAVIRWLRSLQQHTPRTWIMHNALADMGWGSTEGWDFGADVHDTMAMACLLSERELSYGLDACARREGIHGKDDRLLWEGFAAIGGKVKKNTTTKAVKEVLWRLPARYVGPYAEQDVRTTRELFRRYMPRLAAEQLTEVYDLERELLPLLIDMRARGIRIDMNEAERLWDHTHGLEVETRKRIKWRFGVDIGKPKSAAELARACDALGLRYPWTAGTAKRKPQPSFTKDWMAEQTHPFFAEVNYLRHVLTIRSLCLESCMLAHVQRGRVHPELNPLRKTDGGGTVSGRFSCSNPNDQQVSKRSDLGLMVRGCFVPEEGEQWNSCDVSEQEPRLTVHFAQLLGLHKANEAAAAFAAGRGWHDMVADLTGLPRSDAKIINLAGAYGATPGKLARQMRRSIEEARRFYDQYHREMPFVKQLMGKCAERIHERGYIRTLMGRRARFDTWEPVSIKRQKDGKRPTPLPRELAVKKWGEWNIKRARDYVGLNALIQGTAADWIKLAMRQCARDGLGKYLLLQVHDELCSSVPNAEVAREIQHRIATAVQLRCSVKVGCELGSSWKGAK